MTGVAIFESFSIRFVGSYSSEKVHERSFGNGSNSEGKESEAC